MSLMPTDQQCFDEYIAWREKHGWGKCDRVIKFHNHQRLENAGREKRKQIPDKRKRELFMQQEGRCAICGNPMAFNLRESEADHIDPNRQDLNAKSNWQMVHKDCNRQKGAASVMEQTKKYGKTAIEILGDEP